MNATNIKVLLNHLILTYQKGQEVVSADIYNMAGQKVLSSVTNSRINVSTLSSGVYMLRLQSANGTTTKKFVVQ